MRRSGSWQASTEPRSPSWLLSSLDVLAMDLTATGLAVSEVDLILREVARSTKKHPLILIIALFLVAAITIVAGFGVNV